MITNLVHERLEVRNSLGSRPNCKGVSDGLENSQRQIRKKIFEFDFSVVLGRNSAGMLNFLRHGFQCVLRLKRVELVITVSEASETDRSSAGTQLCDVSNRT